MAHGDPGVHLLVLFALEAMGIATLPFQQPADGGIEAALAHCDLILAAEPLERLVLPTVILSTKWLLEAFDARRVALIARRIPAHQTVNVFTTSGSSSAAKGIVFDSDRLDARIRARLWQYGLSATSHVLAAMPPGTSSTYFIAQAALRVGATLNFADPAKPLADAACWTHAIILPIHLRLLAEASEDLPPARQLNVYVVGARLSAQVRELARVKLNAQVHEAYGTTETGWLTLMDTTFVGDVLPDVDVEVVDQERRVQPIGQIGEVRARSPEMASRYLDADLTSACFREGWYYTGDVGRLTAYRRLELLGRTDAMLNFGGLKLSAEVIEDTLAQHQLGADLAVASRADREGIETLVIFLQDARLAGQNLRDAIARALGRNLGRIAVTNIDRIPRSANGKVQRGVLASLARTPLEGIRDYPEQAFESGLLQLLAGFHPLEKRRNLETPCNRSHAAKRGTCC